MSSKGNCYDIVPMSDQVMALFESLKPIALVFIGRNDRTKSISKKSVN